MRDGRDGHPTGKGRDGGFQDPIRLRGRVGATKGTCVIVIRFRGGLEVAYSFAESKVQTLGLGLYLFHLF